jgi:hypothetical protein
VSDEPMPPSTVVSTDADLVTVVNTFNVDPSRLRVFADRTGE